MTSEQKNELYQSLLKAIEDYDLRYDAYLDIIKSICGDGSKIAASFDDLRVTGNWSFSGILTIDISSGEISAKVYGDFFGDADNNYITLDKELENVNLNGDELPNCTFETLPKYISDKAYKSLSLDKEEIIGEILDDLDEEIDLKEAEDYLFSIFEYTLTKCITEARSNNNLKKIIESQVNEPEYLGYLLDERDYDNKYHSY